MKKLLLIAALLLGTGVAGAQEMALSQSKFSDNWSFGLKGGGITPMNHAAFWGDMRGIFGAELRKQISPVFGIGIEGEWSVNTSRNLVNTNVNVNLANGESCTAIDHQYVGVHGLVNLNNLFAGYNGVRRLFEVNLVAGCGWGHAYYHSYNNGEEGLLLDETVAGKEGGNGDWNYFVTKAGLDLNFNLGKSRAWTIGLKPAFVWNMNYKPTYHAATNYNINGCSFELEAGVTYHFKNSNGEHYMTLVRAYDQAEIDGLNGKINELRGELDAANANISALDARNRTLAAELEACKNKKPEVVKVENNQLSTVRYVNFAIGKSTIPADQTPNVAAVASYLKNHPTSKVVIKGFASQDGPIDVNTRLANERAASVKNSLIKKYGIKEDRIVAEGQGIGHMFEEESWNRVAICTLDEK